MHDDDLFDAALPTKTPGPKRTGSRLFFRWTIVVILGLLAASWCVFKLAIGRQEQQSIETLDGVQAYTTTWWGGVEDVHLAQVDASQLIQLGELDLSTLYWLRLSDCDIGDDDLVHLTALRTLKDLNVRGLPITDEGLPHLQRLQGLMRVDVTDTQVTFEGVKKLEQAMPGLRIDWR